jgi:hypothetical protein
MFVVFLIKILFMFLAFGALVAVAGGAAAIVAAAYVLSALFWLARLAVWAPRRKKGRPGFVLPGEWFRHPWKRANA